MFLVRDHLNLDFLLCQCIFFPFGTAILNITMSIWKFVYFIERVTQYFIPKVGLRKIFLCKETMLRNLGMKSDGKPFFFRIYAILEKLAVIYRYISLFWRLVKIFITQGDTDSPFNSHVQRLWRIIICTRPFKLARNVKLFIDCIQLRQQHFQNNSHKKKNKQTNKQTNKNKTLTHVYM